MIKNHPPIPNRLIERALADAKRAVAASNALPTWDDLKREIPGIQIKDLPNGKREARLEGKPALLRFQAMTEEHRRLSSDLGADLHSCTPTVDLAAGGRGSVAIPERFAEVREKRTGMRRVRRWGRGRRLDGSEYDPTRKLRTAAEIFGWTR